jgi:hypothetical protein
VASGPPTAMRPRCERSVSAQGVSGARRSGELPAAAVVADGCAAGGLRERLSSLDSFGSRLLAAPGSGRLKGSRLPRHDSRFGQCAGEPMPTCRASRWRADSRTVSCHRVSIRCPEIAPAFKSTHQAPGPPTHPARLPLRPPPSRARRRRQPRPVQDSPRAGRLGRREDRDRDRRRPDQARAAQGHRAAAPGAAARLRT